jgi:uncharacterized membrane protein YeiH
VAAMSTLLASSAVHWGGFEWRGSFTILDLTAASTNAICGALLARRPDHYKQFTIVGILLMALLGGLGGIITRDVMVAQVPAALTNPAYITLALAFGVLGYFIAYGSGELFREGLFQFMTAFSVPWYAIVGAQRGVSVGLPVLGCLLLGIVGPTAGRYYIDLTSGVTAKHFIRSEWLVTTALLTALVWILVDWTGAGTWWAAGIAFAFGFTFRLLALFRGWEEPLPKGPRGIVIHRDHPLLGRTLRDKSERELRELGLAVEDGPDAATEPTPVS